MKLKVIFTTLVALFIFYGMDYLGSLIQTQNQNIKLQGEEMEVPRYLYIIVSPEIWEVSLKTDALALPPHHDRFIHLAKQDQVAHVTQKFWGRADYYILKVETEKLIGRLVYETNPGGKNRYYHLYDGVIPLESVVESTFIKSNGS